MNKIWTLLFGAAVGMFQGCLSGCATPAEKLLNSAEMQSAMVQMVRDSHKTWQYGGRLANPELDVLYVTGVQIRLVGIDAEVDIRGATTAQTPTPDPPLPQQAKPPDRP